jgi:Uma2 family endonuclease
MSIVTPTPTDFTNAAVPAELIWRLSVDQYHEMIRTGILRDDDPVELLEGWLVPKMLKNPPHRVATRLVRQALERAVPSGWYVDDQEPITTRNSEPEPDVAVIRGDTRDYLDRHPGPHDLALIVEVADTTLERDRTTKKRLYASAEIAVYWIVNLPEQHVEVYTEPAEAEPAEAEPPDYRRRQDFRLGDAVPLLIEGEEIALIAVKDVLP